MQKYFLGADVSKGYTDFILLDRNKEVVIDSFQLDDTFQGHNELHNILKEFLDEHNNARIYAGFESTGGYEDNWLYFLRKLKKDYPIEVTRLNPNFVSKTRKAELAGNVTDKISAKAIAYHLINMLPKIDFNREDPYSNIRRTWTHLRMLKKQKTQLLNLFESSLYITHTQLISHCKEGVPEWVLKLVIEYPTADTLSRGHVSKISKIPYITEEKAKKLKQKAKKSVASASDNINAEMLKDLAKNILSYKEKIKKWEDKLISKCNLEEVRLLTTIPGIAEYTAVGLMLNMGSVEKFDHVKKLASYWGVHPEIRVSGDGRKEPGMSKKGRPVPRELLFTAVFSSVGSGNYIDELYEKYVQEKGKKEMSAIGILMHKITRMIYGMLKNGTVFNPETDRRNRTKNDSQSTENNDYDRKRRYQKFDPSAPVSKRENKKRRERVETQGTYAPNTGSSTSPSSNNKVGNKIKESNQ